MTQPGPDDAGAGVSANPVNAASPASGETPVTRSSTSSKASAPPQASFAALPSNLKTCSKNWKEKYVMLRAFHAKEGHCLVPLRSVRRLSEFDGLGQWVAEQHTAKASLSANQVKYLTSLGLWEAKANKRPVRKPNANPSLKRPHAKQPPAKVRICL